MVHFTVQSKTVWFRLKEKHKKRPIIVFMGFKIKTDTTVWNWQTIFHLLHLTLYKNRFSFDNLILFDFDKQIFACHTIVRIKIVSVLPVTFVLFWQTNICLSHCDLCNNHFGVANLIVFENKNPYSN